MSEEVATEHPIPGEPESADSRKRLVEIRCGFAELAQLEADAAVERVAEARRLYDEQAAALIKVQAEVDPGLTQVAKDKAHSAFRAAVAAARSRGQVEGAAVAWLKEINRINGQSRVALARVEHEHAVADALQKQLTKLSDTAEATATMAVAAVEACRAARAALATPEPAPAVAEPAVAEPADAAPAGAAPARTALPGAPPGDGAWTPEVAALAARAAKRKAAAGRSAVAVPLATPAAPAAAAVGAPGGSAVPGGSAASAASAASAEDDDPLSARWLVIDLSAPRPQAIVKLVRRDGRAMSALVDRLAGSDQTARYDWQVQLSNLIDSIVAAAIDDAWFEFAAGNPFWDQFRAVESREVARGLAALGFRYDGFGAFVDGRVPTNRDLALAVGQAGLLPVKIRHWPSGDEAAQLFSAVHVSADKFLAARAPALTLGELVRLLGRRAELLADLWNNWPRCRPLLFSTAF